ncbi:hypothetical protein [uncultured Pseudonocardia sp.]|uniref:hypothetical protein n=1 Tax=uncultured Pseudonocardia sp. TaxID=211455 RepID=UPI00260C75A6|nr:hypothetical protein [uncultured Pseudonocardia sp.]
MAAIPFPGVAGGIEWRVRLSRPVIDLHPQSVALPPELALAQGGLSIRLGVEICLDCRRLRIDPRPPRPNDDDTKPATHPLREATCCKLEVFAVGGLQRVAAAGGQDAITFRIDGVEIVDVAPEEVERLLECLLFMILQAVLATIRIPLTALRAGAFALALTVGPAIEDDQVKARGI